MTNNKYFVLSTEREWLTGYRDSLKVVENRLELDPNLSREKGYRGIYLSTSFDSGEYGMSWHRLKLELNISLDATIYVSYFASDSNTVIYNKHEYEIDQLITGSELSTFEKEQALKHLWLERMTNPHDLLLHQAQGRFLWFKLELVSYGLELPSVTKAKVFFPRKTLVQYLPEIYEQDPQSYDILNRYLGIFQNLLDDLDHDVRRMSSYLAPDNLNRDFLQWLARWLAIDKSHYWTDKQLSYLVKNAYRLYKLKGTRQGIEEVVELYTGVKPLLIESFEVEDYLNKQDLKNLYYRLYGDNPYTFTVLVPQKKPLAASQHVELKQIIDGFKPAHSIVNLVLLKPYLFVDSYTYLGINSILSGSSSLVLDGQAAIPFDTFLQTGGLLDEE